MVDLTPEELLLLRVRLTAGWTYTAPEGIGMPAINSELDAKLSAAQRAAK